MYNYKYQVNVENIPFYVNSLNYPQFDFILSPDDPARNINIRQPSKLQINQNLKIWERNIPDYNTIRHSLAVVDIETTGLKKDDKFAVVLAIGVLLNDSYYVWSLPKFDNMIDFWDSYQYHEKPMLQNFINWIDSRSDIYCLFGHNIFNFDIPYINKRCEYHNIHSSFTFKPDWRGELTEVKNTSWNSTTLKCTNYVHPNFNIVDTMHLAAIADKQEATLDFLKLKYIVGPDGYNLRNYKRVDIEGDKIKFEFINNYERFHEYLRHDCIDTMLAVDHLFPPMYYMLKYVPAPNLHELIFWGNGQIWNSILRKKYGYKPESDPKINYLGGLSGLASGFFTNLWKLDVKSLYPSIQLHFALATRKDPQGYALKALWIFRELRYKLKKLGREHFQKTIKILMNSFYGFHGTSFVDFNDMKVAEEIPAIGRRILAEMITFCKLRNVTIVHADTDGIIISSPHGKEIHQEMQAYLPDYIDVELESSLEWYWGYRRKNYIICEKGKIKGKGIFRKRERSKLFIRLFKKLPLIYQQCGMEGCKKFIDNIVDDLKNKRVPIEMLVQKKKVTEYKDTSTTNNLALDLKATPGEKISCYISTKTIEKISKVRKIKSTKDVKCYKRLSDFDPKNPDYNSDHYIQQLMDLKWSDKKQEYTKLGWWHMFRLSIEEPINETTSGRAL